MSALYAGSGVRQTNHWVLVSNRLQDRAEERSADCNRQLALRNDQPKQLNRPGLPWH